MRTRIRKYLKNSTWIADKEAKAKVASDEYGDGSAGTAAYYDKSAELTMTRCEELIEYLK